MPSPCDVLNGSDSFRPLALPLHQAWSRERSKRRQEAFATRSSWQFLLRLLHILALGVACWIIHELMALLTIIIRPILSRFCQSLNICLEIEPEHQPRLYLWQDSWEEGEETFKEFYQQLVLLNFDQLALIHIGCFTISGAVHCKEKMISNGWPFASNPDEGTHIHDL